MWGANLSPARRSALLQALLVGCIVLVLGSPSATAGAALMVRETDFKGNGRCQFAVHDFTLAPQTEKAINDSVQKLLDRHRAVLGFRPKLNFRLRIRVFGRYEDYTNATFALYWTNAVDRRALQGRPFNVAGFYTPTTKEIVTWRQQMPGFLGTTLLHEASHAIMDAHYEDVPYWLMEGAADYFAFALHPPGELHRLMLRQRWTQLHRWLGDSSLLSLESLITAGGGTFKAQDPEKAYTMSWSFFQLLMSSEANRRMVIALLEERQTPSQREWDCAEQLTRLYPGGLKRLETAWHAWILAGASATNAPDRRPVTPPGSR
jgi:hypothetical protein